MTTTEKTILDHLGERLEDVQILRAGLILCDGCGRKDGVPLLDMQHYCQGSIALCADCLRRLAGELEGSECPNVALNANE